MLRLARGTRLPRGYHRPTDGAWHGSDPEPALLANATRAVPGTTRAARQCGRDDHHPRRGRASIAPRRCRQTRSRAGPDTRRPAAPAAGGLTLRERYVVPLKDTPHWERYSDARCASCGQLVV